ncbi:hypothetical protein H0H93_011874 [Arthromyces matolae]|nr:hypothetical protein H0H93_011874 [Arthromyces matolae]
MDGFAFQPAMQASFYMSPNPVGGGSMKTLVPIDRACVFFDKGYVGSGTGIYMGNKPLSKDVFLDDEVRKKAIKLTNGGYWIETDWDIY